MALSIESRALQASYEVFTTIADPTTLVTLLYSNDLMAWEEKSRAMLITLTPSQQLNVAYDSLMRRVNSNPLVLPKVVQVLMMEPTLAAVGRKIEG